jgi:3-oxoacyl-[acyl-carrier-protein] synthase-3
MLFNAGISAVSVEFPRQVRNNSFWEKNYPEMLTSEDDGAFVRLLASDEYAPADNLFDAERRPYMADPFRGARERRVLGEAEGTLDLEERALVKLCQARGIDLGDVDAVMVASWMPDTLGFQNAAYLVRRLGMKAAAWNFESACNSSIVGLQSAASLVRSREYERVAVVISAAYSKMVDPDDRFSWFFGDGAGAFLVERAPDGTGVLGSKVISTQETCGSFACPIEVEPDGLSARVRWRAGDVSSGMIMRDNAGPQLTACVGGALERSGHTLDDVGFFVFNTPVAWFSSFCAKTLGVDPGKTLSVYPSYANIAAALTPVNLFHAARAGKIKSGDLIVLFGIGSASTSGAMVMRWGDVALGPVPEPGVPASAPGSATIVQEAGR